MKVPTQVLVQKIGPVGGHGGASFDMDTNGISRFVKISVRVSTVINSFGVSFIRDGREESAGMWGSTPGSLEEVPPFCISLRCDHINPLQKKNEMKRRTSYPSTVIRTI